MKTNVIVKLLGVAACAAVFGLAPKTAHAGQIAVCTVQYVRALNERVVLKCAQNSAEVNIWGSAWTACGSRLNSDTFKIFASIAQAGLLSGKPLLVNYTDTDASCYAPANAVTLLQISQ